MNYWTSLVVSQKIYLTIEQCNSLNSPFIKIIFLTVTHFGLRSYDEKLSIHKIIIDYCGFYG